MELTDRKTDTFAYRPLYRLKLQLPAGYSPASMRRSQSAVQATADYLGTRVARLSYLNPDEANKKYLYLQSPQKVNDKGKFKLHVRQRANQAVCMLFCRFCGGRGSMWIIQRDFKTRQLDEMYIGCLDQRDKQAAEGSGFALCVW